MLSSPTSASHASRDTSEIGSDNDFQLSFDNQNPESLIYKGDVTFPIMTGSMAKAGKASQSSVTGLVRRTKRAVFSNIPSSQPRPPQG